MSIRVSRVPNIAPAVIEVLEASTLIETEESILSKITSLLTFPAIPPTDNLLTLPEFVVSLKEILPFTETFLKTHSF